MVDYILHPNQQAHGRLNHFLQHNMQCQLKLHALLEFPMYSTTNDLQTILVRISHHLSDHQLHRNITVQLQVLHYKKAENVAAWL
jgi:hypothetical protein